MIDVNLVKEFYINQRLKPVVVARKLNITREELDEIIKENNLKEEKNNLRKQTMIRKYGSASPLGNKKVREKAKETLIKNYGVDNPLKNKEIKQKVENTNIEKYGTKSPLGNKEIYDKTYNSNKENHNGKLAWNTEKSISNHNYKEIKQKSLKTLRDKYNIEHPIQNLFTDEQKNILLNKENFDKYISERYNKSKNAVLIYEELGIQHFVFYNYFYKYKLNEKYTFKKSSSKEEYEIINWLKDLKPDIKIIQCCRKFKDINNKIMELDIYLPEYNVAIEYNGTYWHSKLNIENNNYHYNKSLSCENLGIRLIHVFEYEWKNDRQKEILKNIIKSSIGLIENKIYARKCKIEIRKPIEVKEFFNRNNIQGFRNGKFAICLTYNNEIVMSYIFGHPFFGKGKYEWEVIRGATELNTTVIGGASKIFKYFIDSYNPTNCVYYVDYNYFNGNSLNNLPKMKFVKSQVSFKNLFLETGEVKNRQPAKYKEIKELEEKGLITKIYNAGTKVYLWEK